MTESTLTERLQALISKHKSRNPQCPYEADEILSASWLEVATGAVKEQGDLRFAVLKGLRQLDADYGNPLTPLDWDPVDPASEQTLDVDEQLSTLQLGERVLYQAYVDNDCCLYTTAKQFNISDMDELAEMMERCRKSLLEEAVGE